jgi:3-hydroxyacyl-[acyl-carrier-protein] dehydratase
VTANELLGLIPHAEPFLFVDDVVELSDDRIVAVKRADPEAPFFAGHYPGNPVMPGVLICEAAFQAGAVLMARRLGKDALAGRTPILTRIAEARFRNVVRPGQTLDIEVVLDDELDQACYMTGRVTVDGKPVLRVEFVVKMVEGGAGGGES